VVEPVPKIPPTPDGLGAFRHLFFVSRDGNVPKPLENAVEMTTCTLMEVPAPARPAERARITAEMTVGHVAERYPVTMRLFNACDIDTRHGRMLTLVDVADRLRLDITELLRALARAAEDAASDYTTRPSLPLES
jgi:hypothetical protein